jgi:preprotein translocase subunit SecD
VFFRPVLCYAPPFAVAAGGSPDTGPLPTCAAASQLTAADLAVDTSTGQATQDPPADPQFAAYPSTSLPNDTESATVLLPGLPAQGTGRYVLGPAQVTRAQITSAKASLDPAGEWTVNVNFSASGAAAWDTLSEQQFHAIIGIDLDARVITAPITQPSQTSFTSFGGQVQVSGNFNEQQAKTLAGEL